MFRALFERGGAREQRHNGHRPCIGADAAAISHDGVVQHVAEQV